jgi:hypothetical protein
MNKLRHAIFCTLVCTLGFLSAHAQADPANQNISALNGCARFDVGGLTTLGFQITGTSSLTLQPEASIGGQAPFNIQVTPSTSSTPQSTITTSGSTNIGFVASVAGYNAFFLCATSYSSGTATIHFWGTTHPSSTLSGNGGASGTVNSGTAGYPATYPSSSTTVGPSFIYQDVSQIPGATLDAQIATAFAQIPSGQSGIVNAQGVQCASNTTLAANPFQALVGAGYGPNAGGILLLPGCIVTENQPLVVPGGWQVIGMGTGEGSNTIGTVLQASLTNFSQTYTTGTATNAASTGGSTSTYSFTVTGSSTSWTSAMVGEYFVACLGNTATSASSGSACGSSFASSAASGIITAASATSLTVITNNPVTANGTGYDYVIYGALMTMGDFSGSSAQPQNFGVYISNMALQTNGVSGVVGIENDNCSNMCHFDYVRIFPSNNAAVLLQGASTQQAGPYGPFWVIGQNGNCGNGTIGVIARTSTAFPMPLRDISVSLNACGTNGPNENIAIDGPIELHGWHVLTGKTGVLAGSSGVLVGGAPLCPVVCISQPYGVSMARIQTGNCASYVNYCVEVATTVSTPSSVTVEDVESAAGNNVTDIFLDNVTGCKIPQASENSLGFFITDSAGNIAGSSSRVAGCQYFGNAQVALATNTAITSTSFVTTGLVLPSIGPSLVRHGWCDLRYAQLTAAAANTFGVGFDNAPTDLYVDSLAWVSTTAAPTLLTSTLTAVGPTAVTGTVTPGSTGTAYVVKLDFTIKNGASNESTATIYAETGSGSDTLDIAAGSACGWYP